LGDTLITQLKTSKGRISLGGLRLSLNSLRQGAWMFATTMIGGSLHYLANAAVGRMLHPADYSAYASMLSLTLNLGAVTTVIETVATNYVARLRAAGRMEDVGALLLYLLRQLLPWGALGVMLLWLLGHPLAGVLRLPSATPVWVMAIGLVPIVALPVLQGGLRGLEWFRAYGINVIGLAALRLGIGVGLILVGWGAVGAVASLPLSNLGTLILALICLASILRSRNRTYRPDLSGILRYASYAVVGLFAFTALTNMDVIVVKSRFAPDQAGLYSAIATIGKITLYLPLAAATLLLPRVAVLNAHRECTAHLLRKTLWIVGGLCGIVTLAFFFYPSHIVRLLFGAGYLTWASLLGPYGLAMTFYSLGNVWLAYYLALEARRYPYALLGIATVQAVMLFALPLSLPQIVTVLIGGGVVLNLLGRWFLSTYER
jgi:O-antigen/teichoic acid export membrane protein